MSRRSTTDRCPICDQAPSPEFKPFCSRGCKDRDLLQWLGDGYRIPGPPADPDSMQSGLDRPENHD